jgi:hypothetical protein
MKRRFVLAAALLALLVCLPASVPLTSAAGDTLDQFQTYITDDNSFVVGADVLPFRGVENVGAGDKLAMSFYIR